MFKHRLHYDHVEGPLVFSEKWLRVRAGKLSFRQAFSRDFQIAIRQLDAVKLRRWDDAAKAPRLQTPDLAHFRRYVELAHQAAA